jgi:hypothetical protein
MGSKKRRRWRLACATVTIVAASLITAGGASASVNLPTWYYNGAGVPFGKSVEVNGNSLRGLNLQYVDGGGSLPVWVNCSYMSVSGKVENPGTGNPGAFVEPYGSFRNCELIQFGEKTVSTGLECTIAKELPAEMHGVLTSAGSPSGGLELTTQINFDIVCAGRRIPQRIHFTGVGVEKLSGEQSYSSGTTKVTNQEGGPGTVEYGVPLRSAGGPVSVQAVPYEPPVSTYGVNWYRGGAARAGEALKTSVKQGISTAIGGPVRFDLESVQSGVKLEISCSGNVSGSVENPVGGGAGSAQAGLTLTGCSVPKPEGKHCTVIGSGFSTSTLPGTVIAGSRPLLQLGEIHTKVAEFAIAGCSVAALNHVYQLTGELYVEPQMKAAETVGSWLIPKALNREKEYLFLFGQVASPSVEISAENGGEVITLG